MWRQKRRLFLALGVFLIGWLTFCLVRGPMKLSAFKADLAARGESTDIKQIIPKHPLETENAAPQLDSLISSLGWPTNFPGSFSPMKITSPGRARLSWKLSDHYSEDNVAHAWSVIEKQWDARREQMDQLDKILNRPHLDRYLDFQKGFAVQLPHLGKNKAAVYWFQIAILAEIRRGNLDNVLKTTLNLLRFIRLQFEEPLPISQVVNCAYFQLAVPSLWEVMQVDGWRNDQLESIQKELEQFNFLIPMKQALAVQRAFGAMAYAHLRKSKAYADDMMSLFGSGQRPIAANVGIPLGDVSLWSDLAIFFNGAMGWLQTIAVRTVGTMHYQYWKCFRSYNDEISFLTRHNDAIKQIDSIIKGKVMGDGCQDFKHSNNLQNSNQKYRVAPLIAGNLTMVFDKIITAETLRQMTITALAIKRYQMAYGRLPDSLSLLVPGFISSLPLDPADGNALRYKLTAPGQMLLYSVGTDKIDNGGDPTPEDADADMMQIHLGKDYVWPMPEAQSQETPQ